MNEILRGLGNICRKAGDGILAVYEQKDFNISVKADRSPLTTADLAAHKIITQELQTLAPEIPILSEESGYISYAERKAWCQYFLVDPLDGTKEFIQRNGEFTVNIALVDDHQVKYGAVYVPIKGILYLGDVERKQAMVATATEVKSIHGRAMQNRKITVVASRRHSSPLMAHCLEQLAMRFEIALLGIGSSLKFCMLADGQADLYPRLSPTSEWDTAAAQAIVEAAGGLVLDASFKPLRYNTERSLLNSNFFAFSDAQYPWLGILNPIINH